jgi:hypothetical protein
MALDSANLSQKGNLWPPRDRLPILFVGKTNLQINSFRSLMGALIIAPQQFP